MQVIIVEDEKLLLWSLERSLVKHDLKVEAKTNAEEALLCLKKDCYDWMITDYRLPGISGLELLQKARAICPHIKVAVISAYGSPKLLEELRNSGANLFLSKPFDIDHLLSIIKNPVNDSQQHESLSSQHILLNNYTLLL